MRAAGGGGDKRVGPFDTYNGGQACGVGTRVQRVHKRPNGGIVGGSITSEIAQFSVYVRIQCWCIEQDMPHAAEKISAKYVKRTRAPHLL
jgi:hypothetical protein